jgi:oxaloacetate decarboxylase gamma subunit
MTILEMLGQSGILTLFGIGVVFAFLIIMVIVISQAGKAFRTADSEKAAADKAAAAASRLAYGNIPLTSNSAPVIAAITIAVGEYRKSNQKG